MACWHKAANDDYMPPPTRATLSLLSEIANLNAGLPDRPADSLVAAHATQLDPLARSYGYKVAKAGSIVVVTKA